MEKENPWLEQYMPRINTKSVRIEELADSLKSEQEMTPLMSQGALGTITMKSIR